MGIGATTYHVFNLPQYTLYPQKAAKLIWKLKKRNIAANGALMRNSIVGVWQYWDREAVLENSENIAELTHFDQRCKDSCKIMSNIIASELNEQPINQSELEDYLKTLDSRVLEYISFPIDKNISLLNLDEQEAIGYTLKALSASLWAYYNANSFEDGVKQVIEEGGDADTNGCIAASLLGVKYGFNAIPQQWIDGLNKRDELDDKVNSFIKLLEDKYS
jgi:ADP-ribosylglycohydrolase